MKILQVYIEYTILHNYKMHFINILFKYCKKKNEKHKAQVGDNFPVQSKLGIGFREECIEECIFWLIND